MNIHTSMLSKMADKILKATDKVDAFKESQEKSRKIKLLQNTMTERYKIFLNSPHRTSMLEEVSKDIATLKKCWNKLSPTLEDTLKIDRLFNKYGIQ